MYSNGKDQICYEHVFTNYIEHTNGTNEYKYNFPEHWLQFISKTNEIGLRSIKIQRSSRDIKLGNIYVKRDDELLLNVGTSISLSSNDDMTRYNDKLVNEIYTRYQVYKDEIDNARIDEPTVKSYLTLNDYTMEYLHSTNVFWIKVTKSDDETYLHVAAADSYSNDDFKNVMNISDDSLFENIAALQNGTMERPTFDEFISSLGNVSIVFCTDSATETKIKAIGFSNVWNRDSIFISSSLSTLAEDKFMTISNVEYATLKWYEVNGYVSKFTIYLYDASRKNAVQLPTDGNDLILIEMLLIAK